MLNDRMWLHRLARGGVWWAYASLVLLGALGDVALLGVVADPSLRLGLRWTILGLLATLGGLLLHRRYAAVIGRGVGAQQRATEALRASQDRFRRLADATQEAIIIHDGGRIVELNRAAEQLFGRPGHSLVGTSVVDLVAPEWTATARAHGQGGIEQLYEIEGLRGDGSRVPLEVLGRPLPGGSRHLRVVALRDLTARREAEAAVRRSEARYRQLVEQAADGIFVAAADGRIREVNSSGCALLGYAAAELLQRRVGDLITPEDLARQPLRPPDTSDWDVLRGERRMVRRDGSTIDVDVCVSRLADGSMLGVIRDVTEQKRAAAALRESEERYRLLVETSPVPIGVHSQGRIVYMNRAALRMAGASQPEQVIGKTMLDFVHPDYRAMVAERARRALVEGLGAAPAEEKFLRLDGQVLDAEMASMPIMFNGQPAVQVVMHDITERKRAEAALRHQALHDALTGLPNRVLFDQRVRAALPQAAASGLSVALLVIDLDRFKEVNDSLGHRFGDIVLEQVAARWQATLGERGLLARLSGDEFAVLLSGADAETARAIGVRLQRDLEAPFVIDDHRFGIGASVGIGLWPAQASDAESLLRHADMAMYAAKQAGSGCLVYAPEHDRHRPGRLALVSELREAIAHNELVLYYQPQVAIASRAVTGVEALVRWQHAKRGLLGPDEFIPLAEETGLIGPLSRWVLERALATCRAWQDAGLDLAMSVNLSMRDLHDPHLPATVAALLDAHEVEPRRLKIEITESSLMANPGRASDVLGQLRALGVQVAVDDFGTGYSSLAYLKGLPVDELKLDRSFVRDLVRSSADRAIVRSTVSLGHDLGLSVVAEGVEDQATYELARHLGCDLAQGYLLARPLSADQLLAWLETRSGPLQSAAAAA